MIAAILYVGFISILFLISFNKEIYAFYCILMQKKMVDLFPHFYDWKEGDNILYMANWEDDRKGELVAMSQDAIVIKNKYNNNVELQPQQIKQNLSHQIKDKKQKYKTFHKDILPAVTETDETFPKLKSKNEISF